VADHYLCYRANVHAEEDDHGEENDDDDTEDQRFPRGIRVGLLDEFNQPRLFEVRRPTRLCTPAIKTHGEITYGADLENPSNHLTCYRVKPVPGQGRHQRVHGILTKDQFGDLRLDSLKERELCVPSTKFPQ
jgi:hypothetical protein